VEATHGKKTANLDWWKEHLTQYIVLCNSHIQFKIINGGANMIDVEEESYEVTIANTLQDYQFILPEDVDDLVTYLRMT
jgi:hypothetical protein